MLHTKPQGQWPFGSGEEDFWSVFTIYGRGSQLGHVTQTPRTNFRSPIPVRLHMKFGFGRPSGFGEEELWKWWTTDDGLTMDHGYTISSPMSLKAQVSWKDCFDLVSCTLKLFVYNLHTVLTNPQFMYVFTTAVKSRKTLKHLTRSRRGVTGTIFSRSQIHVLVTVRPKLSPYAAIIERHNVM